MALSNLTTQVLQDVMEVHYLNVNVSFFQKQAMLIHGYFLPN
jgi:hypothetical protein